MFLVNVPIGLVAVPLAAALLPRDATHRDRQRLDPVGVTLLSAALLALLVPLIEGARAGVRAAAAAPARVAVTSAW